jgi:serine/threonine-protein kinase
VAGVDDDTTTTRMPRLTPVGGTIETGAEVGDYQVLRELGSGGMGSVFQVLHRPSGRTAALKVLRTPSASPDAIVRFEREVRALSELHHPHIVEIYEFGALADGRPFFVMEHLVGLTVLAHVRRSGRMPLASVLPVITQVADALSAAHATGILHRDIKPSNVVLSHRHRRQRAVLVDFGIAKFVDDQAAITQRQHVVGTLPWMAPEQFLGQPVDARVDVYGLAALTYSMLTARPPFPEGDHGAILSGPRPRASDDAEVADGIDLAIMRGLDRTPERRFATPAELAFALRDAAGG